MTTHLPTHAEVLDAAQLLREYFQSMPCGQASLPRIAAMLERLAPLLDTSAGAVSAKVVNAFWKELHNGFDSTMMNKEDAKRALTTVLPMLRGANGRRTVRRSEYSAMTNPASVNHAERLAQALKHMQCCAQCAEGSWNDCDGGREALAALAAYAASQPDPQGEGAQGGEMAITGRISGFLPNRRAVEFIADNSLPGEWAVTFPSSRFVITRPDALGLQITPPSAQASAEPEFWLVPLSGKRYMAAASISEAKNYATGAGVKHSDIIPVARARKEKGDAP